MNCPRCQSTNSMSIDRDKDMSCMTCGYVQYATEPLARPGKVYYRPNEVAGKKPEPSLLKNITRLYRKKNNEDRN